MTVQLFTNTFFFWSAILQILGMCSISQALPIESRANRDFKIQAMQAGDDFANKASMNFDGRNNKDFQTNLGNAMQAGRNFANTAGKDFSSQDNRNFKAHTSMDLNSLDFDSLEDRSFKNMAAVQGPNPYSPAFPDSFILVGTNYGSPGKYKATGDLYNDRPVYQKEDGGQWKVYYYKSNEWVVTGDKPADYWNAVNYWRGDLTS